MAHSHHRTQPASFIAALLGLVLLASVVSCSDPESGASSDGSACPGGDCVGGDAQADLEDAIDSVDRGDGDPHADAEDASMGGDGVADLGPRPDAAEDSLAGDSDGGDAEVGADAAPRDLTGIDGIVLPEDLALGDADATDLGGSGTDAESGTDSASADGSAAQDASTEAGDWGELGPDCPAPGTADVRFLFVRSRTSDEDAIAPGTSTETLLEEASPRYGSVLARFDGPCLRWAARNDGRPGAMVVDPEERKVYLAIRSFAQGFELEDSAGEVVQAWPRSPDPGAPAATYLARYDFAGQLDWAVRVGPEVYGPRVVPTPEGLTLSDAGLRLVATQPPRAIYLPFPFVFGQGQSDAFSVTIEHPFGYGYGALFDPDTGRYRPGTARVILPFPCDTFERECPVDLARSRGEHDGSYFAGRLGGPAALYFLPSYARPVEGTWGGFVARLDRRGRPEWIRMIGEGSYDTGSPESQANLEGGGVVVAGPLLEYTVFEDGDGTYRPEPGEGEHAYIARYDEDGGLDWLVVLRRGGSWHQSTEVVADDANDALYARVTAARSLSFERGGVADGEVELSRDSEDVIVRFRLSTGAFEWARRIRTPFEGDNESLRGRLVGPVVDLRVVDGVLEVNTMAFPGATLNSGRGDEIRIPAELEGYLFGIARWQGDGSLAGWYPMFRGGEPPTGAPETWAFGLSVGSP